MHVMRPAPMQPPPPTPCLCPAQMLSHPLMLDRFKILAAVADTAAATIVAPGLALGSQTWLSSCDTSGCGGRLCRQTLLYLELTIAVLPIFILAWVTRPGLEVHLPGWLDRAYRLSDRALRAACIPGAGWAGRAGGLFITLLLAWAAADMACGLA